MRKIILVLILTIFIKAFGLAQTTMEFDYIADRLNYETASFLLGDNTSLLGERKDYSRFYRRIRSLSINARIADDIYRKGRSLNENYSFLSPLNNFNQKIDTLIAFCVKQLIEHRANGKEELNERLIATKIKLIEEASDWYVDKIIRKINEIDEVNEKIEFCTIALNIKTGNIKLHEKLTELYSMPNASGKNDIASIYFKKLNSINKDVEKLRNEIKEIKLNAPITENNSKAPLFISIFALIFALAFALLVLIKLDNNKK